MKCRFVACLIMGLLLTPSGAATAQQPPDPQSQGSQSDPPEAQAAQQQSSPAPPAPVSGDSNQGSQAIESQDDAPSAESTDLDTRLVEVTEDLADFTFALFVATAGLFVATLALVIFAARQSRDFKASMEIAKNTAEGASTAATAAVEANRLNRDNFLATQRPWIRVGIEVGGPLVYNVNGANITLRFHLTNVGHSPATHVTVNTEVFAPGIGVDQGFDPLGIQRRIAQRLKATPLGQFGFMIFPGESASQLVSVSIGAEELRRITRQVEFIMIWVVGCVDYSFVFEAGHHQTGFAIEVSRSDRPRSESAARNRSPAAIFPDEGDIPAEDLRFVRSFIGGEYAD